MQKSEQNEEKWRNGLESGVRHGESPNGALKCGGMDFEAAEKQAEVQKW